MSDPSKSGLDVQEQVARIDRELAHVHALRSEAQWKPWQVAIAALAAAATLLGAGAAIGGVLIALLLRVHL